MNLAAFENRISFCVFAGTMIVAACSFLAIGHATPLRIFNEAAVTRSQSVETRLPDFFADIPGVVVSAAADLRSNTGNTLRAADLWGRRILAE